MKELEKKRKRIERSLEVFREYENISETIPFRLEIDSLIYLKDTEIEEIRESLKETQSLFENLVFRYKLDEDNLDKECGHKSTKVEYQATSHKGHIYYEICQDCGKIIDYDHQ